MVSLQEKHGKILGVVMKLGDGVGFQFQFVEG